MSEGELCAKCGKGHMEYQGKHDVYRSESTEPFNPQDEMTGLVCDNCGHEQKAEHRSLDDNVRVSDSVSASVRRIDPEDKIEE